MHHVSPRVIAHVAKGLILLHCVGATPLQVPSAWHVRVASPSAGGPPELSQVYVATLGAIMPLEYAIEAPSSGGSAGHSTCSVQSGRHWATPCSAQVRPSPLYRRKQAHSWVPGPVWVQAACSSQSFSSPWQIKAGFTASWQESPAQPSSHWHAYVYDSS